MTALSANRNTKRMGNDAVPAEKSYPMTDNQHCYVGGLVGKDSAGNARPMTLAATTAMCLGICEADSDNTVSGHTAAGIQVPVRQGVGNFIDGGVGGSISKANVGSPCYASDDQTVNLGSNGSTYALAGIIQQVDSDGVWVQVGLAGLSGSDATTLAGLLTAGGVALGDLQKIGYTPGVATGGYCDVVCAITDLAGGAISGARQVTITTIPVTEGAGNGLLAAAGTAVGTVLKALNPSTGAHVMSMDSGSTGLFSFRVTDGVNEAVVVRIEADGCRPLIKKITISGN